MPTSIKCEVMYVFRFVDQLPSCATINGNKTIMVTTAVQNHGKWQYKPTQ